jgi:hypothetical protein
MWPDDGRLSSHEFPPTPSSFFGKHYAVSAEHSANSQRSDREIP